MRHMQLDPGERSILATFASHERANDAAQALKDAGFPTVQVRDWGKYGPPTDNREFNDPVRGQAYTISGLTQLSGGEFPSRSAGILVAADPAASGMSGPPVNDRNVLLTAVVPVARTEEAVQIIEQHGGAV